MISLNWCNGSTANPMTVEEAIPVAVKYALKARKRYGERFIDGAQSIAIQKGMEAARLNGGNRAATCRVLANIIETCRVSINPRWDGSIA